MIAPNAILTRAYGNEDVVRDKLAGAAPVAARMATALLGLRSGMEGVEEYVRQKEQAAAMNAMFRAMEARRMRPVYEEMAAVHPYAYSDRAIRAALLRTPPETWQNRSDRASLTSDLSTEMTRLASIASDVGSEMAQKEAGIMSALAKGTTGQLVGNLGRGTAGLAKGVTTGVKNLATGAAKGVAALPGRAVQGAQGTLQKAQQGATGLVDRAKAFGQKLEGNLTGAGQKAQASLTGAGQTAQAGLSGKPPLEGQVTGGAKPYRAPPSTPAPATTAQTPVAKTKPTAPVTPGVPPGEKPGLWERSGLSGGSYKWKLPALAAAAGATYLGYKGLKAVGNYMSEESQPRNWNSGGPQLSYGVNQYGYAQPGGSL